jgi:hypothetical protein
MAAGDVIFFTIGYTSASAGSTKPNYPIKKKYKQTEQTIYPSFPSSYIAYEDQEYWFPYDSLEVSEENYIPYETGDEFGWNEDTRKHKPNLGKANPNLRKYSVLPAGTRIYYANNIYVSTDYYFNWSDTEFSNSQNPYSSNRVNKWRKFEDTSDNWVQYWYHPGKKRFYPFKDSAILLALSDDGEFETSKWDLFIGDTEDVNLTNLTISQINEIISTGSTPLAAAATVSSIDTNVVTVNTSTESDIGESENDIIDGYFSSEILSTAPEVTTITIAPRSRSGINPVRGGGRPRGPRGRDNRSPGVSQKPSMIQEYKHPRTGRNKRSRFVFDYTPNNISYTNIGSLWTEIDRINNSPIVDFKNFKHMKISFEFVVSDKSSGIASLYTSCEDQLIQLRKMAARPEFVRFVNFDTLFNKFLTYPKVMLRGNNTSFAIVDMSISSVQRARPDNTTGYSGEINRAVINMTVQEVSTSSPDLIIMPSISPASLNPGKPGEGGGDPETCEKRLSETANLIGPFARESTCL